MLICKNSIIFERVIDLKYNAYGIKNTHLFICNKILIAISFPKVIIV